MVPATPLGYVEWTVGHHSQLRRDLIHLHLHLPHPPQRNLQQYVTILLNVHFPALLLCISAWDALPGMGLLPFGISYMLWGSLPLLSCWLPYLQLACWNVSQGNFSCSFYVPFLWNFFYQQDYSFVIRRVYMSPYAKEVDILDSFRLLFIQISVHCIRWGCI